MIIGIVGGMGSYATLHFFERLLASFPAEKEWDRPRIIIDNRCTMPSRVRAILYADQEPEMARQLVLQLADSIGNLINMGATHIVLACNTSHVFLDKVYELIPEARCKVVHLIDNLLSSLNPNEKYYLLATEGTILSGLYDSFFLRYHVALQHVEEEKFALIRCFIESVKQNTIDEDILRSFKQFISSLPSKNVVLGCTELPVLYDKIAGDPEISDLHVFDPLEVVIRKLRQSFLDENK